LACTVIVLCIAITKFIPRQSANTQQQSVMQQQINDAVMVDPNILAPDFGAVPPAEE